MKAIYVSLPFTGETSAFIDGDDRLSWRTETIGEQDGWLSILRAGEREALFPPGQWAWVKSDFAPDITSDVDGAP